MKQTPFTIFTHQKGLEFLSNMRYYKIPYQSEIFNASENIYQFSKLPENLKKDWLFRFARMNPFTARKITRKLPVREDWEDIKLKVMFDVLRLKFYTHSYLIKELTKIEGPLVEYNYWKDTFWGYDINLKEGKNYLGKLLMLLRDAFKENKNPLFKDLVFYEKYEPNKMYSKDEIEQFLKK